MSTESSEAKSQNHYVKVANVPCLYRHAKTDNYYAVKKVCGKHKEHSLRATDRKSAERRLKEWVANLEKVDTEVEKTTLRQLIAQYQAIRQGMDSNTIVTDRAIINSFTDWWPHGLDIQVRNIRPSQLEGRERAAHQAVGEMAGGHGSPSIESRNVSASSPSVPRNAMGKVTKPAVRALF